MSKHSGSRDKRLPDSIGQNCGWQWVMIRV